MSEAIIVSGMVGLAFCLYFITWKCAREGKIWHGVISLFGFACEGFAIWYMLRIAEHAIYSRIATAIIHIHVWTSVVFIACIVLVILSGFIAYLERQREVKHWKRYHEIIVYAFFVCWFLSTITGPYFLSFLF